MKTSNTSSEKCYAESNSPQKEFENDPECTVTNSSQKASISPNLSEYSDTKPRSSADTNTEGEDVDMDWNIKKPEAVATSDLSQSQSW